MPKLNHPNFGDVQSYKFLEGTIVEVYSEDDTADISIAGYGSTFLGVPIHYHCDGDVDSVQGGSVVFSVGDSVIVRVKIGSVNPDDMRVLGFTDGPKKCMGDFIAIIGVHHAVPHPESWPNWLEGKDIAYAWNFTKGEQYQVQGLSQPNTWDALASELNPVIATEPCRSEEVVFEPHHPDYVCGTGITSIDESAEALEEKADIQWSGDCSDIGIYGYCTWDPSSPEDIRPEDTILNYPTPGWVVLGYNSWPTYAKWFMGYGSNWPRKYRESRWSTTLQQYPVVTEFRSRWRIYDPKTYEKVVTLTYFFPLEFDPVTQTEHRIHYIQIKHKAVYTIDYYISPIPIEGQYPNPFPPPDYVTEPKIYWLVSSHLQREALIRSNILLGGSQISFEIADPEPFECTHYGYHPPDCEFLPIAASLGSIWHPGKKEQISYASVYDASLDQGLFSEVYKRRHSGSGWSVWEPQDIPQEIPINYMKTLLYRSYD
jgi:hypothetical protein